MTNIVAEAAVMLGMVQVEKRTLADQLSSLGVAAPDDQVTTTDQMQALGRKLHLDKLESHLIHFIEGWVSDGGS